MKPILFSTPMVQAILAGLKTQTRRIVKTKNPELCDYYRQECLLQEQKVYVANGINSYSMETVWHKPRYQPGDILWVRETWLKNAASGITPYFYRADDSDPEANLQIKALGYKWRPSIHMPREAARIFLRVTGVRVERVQDITPEDACAEGFGVYAFDTGELMPKWTRQKFIELWNSLYAKSGYSWESNPWVWVYDFERIEKPEGWVFT